MPDPAERPPLLLSVFSTFAVGGPQVRFTTLANRLGQGWRHAIIAMDGNLAARERLDPALDLVFPEFEIDKASPVATYRRLRATIAAVRPDLLLTHNWGSIEWALANRFPARLVPQIHAEDGFGPEERSRQLARRVWTRRLALRGATIVLPSQTLRAIAGEVWRLAPASLHYVPNGIDMDRFDVGETLPPPPGWGLAAGGMVVGTVAALRPEKNLARLLQAFAAAAVDTARLVIVGDGPERGSLERLAATLLPAGRVAFTGHLPDPSRAFRHMDIFALSSDTEQMPLSLLEAMASGLPVAATDVGDVATMVAAENRPFVVAPDTAALGAAIAGLIADPALGRRIGAANRERAVAHYGEGRMVETWARLLEDAWRGRPPLPTHGDSLVRKDKDSKAMSGVRPGDR